MQAGWDDKEHAPDLTLAWHDTVQHSISLPTPEHHSPSLSLTQCPHQTTTHFNSPSHPTPEHQSPSPSLSLVPHPPTQRTLATEVGLLAPPYLEQTDTD